MHRKLRPGKFLYGLMTPNSPIGHLPATSGYMNNFVFALTCWKYDGRPV